MSPRLRASSRASTSRPRSPVCAIVVPGSILRGGTETTFFPTRQLRMMPPPSFVTSTSSSVTRFEPSTMTMLPRSGSEGREGAGCAARWCARGSRARAYQRVRTLYAPSDPGGNRVQKNPLCSERAGPTHPIPGRPRARSHHDSDALPSRRLLIPPQCGIACLRGTQHMESRREGAQERTLAAFSGREVADVTSLLRERAGSVALAVVLAGLLRPPVAAHAAWPQTPPNDPAFAPCENAATFTPNCYSDPGADQWDMFGPLSDAQYPCPAPILQHPDGGLPCWAVAAFDPNHMSGVDFTGAWARGNVGRDDILIAYMEGGVNYSSNSIKDALDHEWLNKGELPCPQRADGTTLAWPNCYDLDGNGRLDIRDYVHDARVNPSCPAGVASDTPVGQGGGLAIDVEGTSRNCVSSGQHPYLNAVNVQGTRTPYLSPEDLIAVFGHCRMQSGQIAQCPPGGRFDNDGNGYPNDINGWNSDRNNNDPQTEDMAYNHAPGLHSLLVGVPDNGYAGVGLCPRCRVVPIKTGAEALGRSDKWAAGLLYAADIGVTAVSSVVVNYTYSRFVQDAINYAYDHGVVMSLDSNDFDSMDHTDGMLWDHALPGNSAAMDLTGSSTSWFRSRSNITSYGTHNVFSGGEYTTSGATPFQAGILAMVQSAALNLRDSGLVPGFDRLTPNEIKQVLMYTAQAIIPTGLPPH